MNDKEVDTWLMAADPARETPGSLSAVVDEVVSAKNETRTRSRWRPVPIAGGAFALAGALAAGTGLGAYLLGIPSFAGLDNGADFRTVNGLDYVPFSGQDRGEQCRMYVDLGGLTDAQKDRVADFWPAIDPEAFADGVEEGIANPNPSTPTDLVSLEQAAVLDETLTRLDEVVPHIEWGATAAEGDPYLGALTTSCVQDVQELEPRT